MPSAYRLVEVVTVACFLHRWHTLTTKLLLGALPSHPFCAVHMEHPKVDRCGTRTPRDVSVAGSKVAVITTYAPSRRAVWYLRVSILGPHGFARLLSLRWGYPIRLAVCIGTLKTTDLPEQRYQAEIASETNVCFVENINYTCVVFMTFLVAWVLRAAGSFPLLSQRQALPLIAA